MSWMRERDGRWQRVAACRCPAPRGRPGGCCERCAGAVPDFFERRGFGNWFAWSHHSYKVFKECPRRWWLSKVLFWGGWDRRADPGRRLAWELTKMKNVWTLSGSIVHDLASEASQGGLRRTTEQAVRRYEFLMTRGWNQSANGLWRQDPKGKTNLFEHYYSVPWAAEHLELALDQGRRAVRELFDQRLRDVGVVVGSEVMEELFVDDMPVRVQMDLEHRRDGVLVVQDWKTGREMPEHRDQLDAYLLARVLGGRSPDEMVGQIDYLGQGRSVRHRPTSDSLERARGRIIREGREIRDLLNPPGERNRAPRSIFPMTENQRTCRTCYMHHACRGRLIKGVSRPARRNDAS